MPLAVLCLEVPVNTFPLEFSLPESDTATSFLLVCICCKLLFLFLSHCPPASWHLFHMGIL